ncbi:MAG: amidohydrolase [Oscillospiraceae bacterium]|nr:amidohydrolase [Oscillospiraceae bacterium]
MKQRALQLKEETIRHRRYIHECAEVGLKLPKTMAYIKEELKICGIEPKLCGNGICAEIGRGEPVLLLRADADALPNGHTCGHDCHAAMLLTAAKLLKEDEQKLHGTVRLMFQPAEETLEGAKNMIDHGILAPTPQAALAFHTAAGKLRPGMALYGSGIMMRSADCVTITFRGKGGHGAYADRTCDPIKMAVEAYQALPEFSFGVFHAGETGNVIPDTAVLKGSVRTERGREKMLDKLERVVHQAAKRYGGSVEINHTAGAPALECDQKLTVFFAGCLKELNLIVKDGVRAKASEDFAYIAREIPSAYFYLTCGFSDGRGAHLAHDPLVQIDEDVLPIGAAAYAHCAQRYLKK